MEVVWQLWLAAPMHYCPTVLVLTLAHTRCTQQRVQPRRGLVALCSHRLEGRLESSCQTNTVETADTRSSPQSTARLIQYGAKELLHKLYRGKLVLLPPFLWHTGSLRIQFRPMLEVHYQQALSAPLPSIILKYIPGCHSPLAMVMFLLTTNIADAVAAASSQ